MKRIIFTIASMALSFNLYAQTSLITGLSVTTRSNITQWKYRIYSEYPSRRISVSSMRHYSFSQLLQMSFNNGYIADNNTNSQNLYMTFDQVSRRNATEYEVSGFSQVRENVCNFNGTLKITEFRQLNSFSDACVDASLEDITNQGYLFGEFILTEDASQSGSGIFKGVFWIKWIVAGNELILENHDCVGGGTNYTNQFYGEWKSNLRQTSKQVGWSNGLILQIGW